MRQFRVGLTGGIASGKSTVANLFAARGVPVIDTDEIARAVVQPGEPALAEVLRAFGAEFRLPDGTLDRQRLRQRVFASDPDRRRLEAILHPAIRAATLQACDRSGGPYQIVVVPLLFESGFDALLERVLVVDCPEAEQRRRLLARDGETPAQVDRILASQADRATRIRGADDIIDNRGKPAELAARVAALHADYLVHAAQFQARPS
ncbi:MAG: dephospho-CoA kinase [Gammaproteobacteria bacterium]|nr:dephospho-CoA kinase [Gammaproteobacteria bacterium]